MDTLKIGSFNTKDNATNRKGGMREDGISNADILANQIKENEFDLIGTQELTIKYVNELVSRLKDYKFYGSYRYGNLLTKIPFNENNNIITKKNVVLQITIWLPWIANKFSDFKDSITKMSIMPRIATIVVIKNQINEEVCMINTHLDYQIPSIQKRQLEVLKKIIEKYSNKYPIILTGDFNMEITDQNFKDFISDVKDKNLKRVEINESTWYDKNGNGKTLDHIFLPNDWDIQNAGIIDLKDTSDHKGIFVETNVKHK